VKTSLLSIFCLSLFSYNLFAYPQFIGHGYTTCLTCHSSPTGGGALSDYGRALFAVEIANKPFWAQGTTDERLSELSGFLGSKKLPYWIRPGVKYRRLFLEVNPGSRGANAKRDYPMQLDLNLNLFLNETQNKGLILTLAHLHRPNFASPNKPISSDIDEFAMREYFWRQSLGVDWISAGFLDKPFGIKHVDHTSFSRTTLPLAQNDQVHGVQYSFYRKAHEAHVMGYAGNLHLPSDQQNAGLSALYEYQPVEKIRYGASLLYQESATDPIYGISTHTKVGLPDQSAWLAEFGSKYQKEWSPYLLSLISYNLSRGLYLEPSFQFSQSQLTSSGVQGTRTGLGLLYFPFQRLELRSSVYYSTTKQANTVGADAWVLQTQLHLSL